MTVLAPAPYLRWDCALGLAAAATPRAQPRHRPVKGAERATLADGAELTDGARPPLRHPPAPATCTRRAGDSQQHQGRARPASVASTAAARCSREGCEARLLQHRWRPGCRSAHRASPRPTSSTSRRRSRVSARPRASRSERGDGRRRGLRRPRVDLQLDVAEAGGRRELGAVGPDGGRRHPRRQDHRDPTSSPLWPVARIRLSAAARCADGLLRAMREHFASDC